MIKAFVLGIPFYLGNPPPRKEREGKLKEERKRIMYRRNTALSQKWVYAPNEQKTTRRKMTYLPDFNILERERETLCKDMGNCGKKSNSRPIRIHHLCLELEKRCVQSRYQFISIYVVIRYLTSQNTIILGKVTSISTRWGIYTLF